MLGITVYLLLVFEPFRLIEGNVLLINVHIIDYTLSQWKNPESIGDVAPSVQVMCPLEAPTTELGHGFLPLPPEFSTIEPIRLFMS